MKIADNVALLPINTEIGVLSLVLTWDDENLVLIDACVPGLVDDVVQAIKAEGFDAGSLTHVILTHQDYDHIGCVTALQKIAPSLNVIVHEDEARYIDGRVLPIKLAERLVHLDVLPDEIRASTELWRDSYYNDKITIHNEVRDGQVLPICGGIEIVHVPGHTPGHIALYLCKSRIMVCGDAANIEDGKLIGSNPIYTQNMEQANKSLDKIKSFDTSCIVTYHGGLLKIRNEE